MSKAGPAHLNNSSYVTTILLLVYNNVVTYELPQIKRER